MQKIIARSIPIFLANFATFKPKNFLVAEQLVVWQPSTHKLKIGKIRDMVFLSFEHIPRLLCKDGISEGGGGSAYP